MFYHNLHSHTNFCDGTHDAADYIKVAIDYGMKVYGYSSHAPVPFHSPWNMDEKNLTSYLSLIKSLKAEHRGVIEIYCGLEADYVPELVFPQELKSAHGLDYVIGSIHFIKPVEDCPLFEAEGPLGVFKRGVQDCYQGDYQEAVKRYFQLTRMMIEESCPDIVGHLDKIRKHNQPKKLFSESASWYIDEIMHALEVIEKKQVIVEVNTRGLYKKLVTDTYPAAWVLKEMHKRNIEVSLNSDAHHPKEMTACFDFAVKQLKSIGYKFQKTLQNGAWQNVPL